MLRYVDSKTIKFEWDNTAHKLTVLDACQSLGKTKPSFDCMDIRNYIAENEVENKTFDWHEIAWYLDALREKGILEIVPSGREFTQYQVVKGE